MSLLDKKSGLVILTLSFLLFACEDPNGNGEVDPRDKVGVHFQEIEVPTTIVLTDSIVGFDTRFDNNNNPGRRRIMTGSYSDPFFGQVSSTGFMQLLVYNNNVPETAVYDSITFSFRPAYQYGRSASDPFTLSVHQIRNDAVLLDTTYLNTVSFPFLENPLGEESFNQLSDTITYDVRIDDVLGRDLFDKLKSKATEVSSFANFSRYLKGLAFVAHGENGLIGFNPLSTETGLRVYYKAEDSEGKLTQRVFTLTAAGVGLSSVNSNRTGTILQDFTDPFKDYSTSDGFTYVQSGTGVLTKLDLSSFLEFMEATPNIIINAAKLEIEELEETDSKYPKPAGLFLARANSNNKLVRNGISPWMISTDNSTNYLLFNESKNNYSAEIANHLQNLKNGNEHASFFLYPSEDASSVNRIRLARDKIKLKIYYTTVR